MTGRRRASKALLAVMLLLGVGGVADAAGEVQAYERKVVLPTWEVDPPQIHPVFPDSGRAIYPHTLNDALSDRRVERSYRAVFLENEYVQLMILPEIGGRLHGALDKTNGYVWLYWQSSIKPGLIGMTGAWISGGIEWNFPHGHRPTSFMPVQHRIVRNSDGSATVWVGETEPIYRMRWLVGMTLFPGRSYLRCDYVLANPTPLRRPFQFWVTAATHANEWAQAQFPGSIVTGHGKKEFWHWPVHDGVDLSWWKSVPNAGSFFAYETRDDWFGTYDHQADAGTVHVADHRLMPGKKMWTWGSGPSGRIWEDILTEEGGPYLEPQAGGFSDNQPDYHWMAPYEVKRLHGYWYPVRGTRGFHKADRDFALNTGVEEGKAFAAVHATSLRQVRIVLKDAVRTRLLHQAETTVTPATPYTIEIPVESVVEAQDLHLSVLDAEGNELLALRRRAPVREPFPDPLEPHGDPEQLGLDELFHAGEWLERFEKPAEAVKYYREALRRDPDNSRVHLQLGEAALKTGQWDRAMSHLDRAMKRDADNPRIYFARGLARVAQGDLEEAARQFHRASYGGNQRGAALVELARLDLRRGGHQAAVEKLVKAALSGAAEADVWALRAAAHRGQGNYDQALEWAERALDLDPVHFMGGYEKLLAVSALRAEKIRSGWEEVWNAFMHDHTQSYLELAVQYGGLADYRTADQVLARRTGGRPPEAFPPMVWYYRGFYQARLGDEAAARESFRAAARGPSAYTNPHRLEAIEVLRLAREHDPNDARATLYLGNLLYSLNRREEGLELWKEAARLEPTLVHAWRNVGYGELHAAERPEAAYEAYRKAVERDPQDAVALLEMDRVAEGLGIDVQRRLVILLQHPTALQRRDDLAVRVIELRLRQGSRESLLLAREELKGRRFHIWEGKYGIHQAWVEVNERLGHRALEDRSFEEAEQYYRQAMKYPRNLQVAPRTPDFRAHLLWNLARLYQSRDESERAREVLEAILAERYEESHLGSFYQALAARAQGDEARYASLLGEVEARARELTSGRFEFRGGREAIGHYLLSLVLEERRRGEEALDHLSKAKERNFDVRRLAIREAQLDVARARQ